MNRWKIPNHFEVLIGGNRYIDCPTIVDYKGQSLFELLRSDTDGLLAINFDLYGPSRDKVATVRNGRFVDFSPEGYQLDSAQDRFVLTETATGRKVCEIKLRGQANDSAEIQVAAQMYMPDGQLIVFDEHGTNIGGNQISGCTFQSCGSAIRIG